VSIICGTLGDVTVEGVISGLLKIQKLFQNEKSVLPGSEDLKQKSGIYILVKMELQLSVE
jgi:hypothetical protein